MAFWNRNKTKATPTNTRASTSVSAQTSRTSTPATPDWIQSIPEFQKSKANEAARAAEHDRTRSLTESMGRQTIAKHREELITIFLDALRAIGYNSAASLGRSLVSNYKSGGWSGPDSITWLHLTDSGNDGGTVAGLMIYMNAGDREPMMIVQLGESGSGAEVRFPSNEFSLNRVKAALAECIKIHLTPRR